MKRGNLMRKNRIISAVTAYIMTASAAAVYADTSAGGKYMGESLHSLSFANQNTYNTTGNVIPADNMFIDFGSIELTCYADMIMNQKPSLLRYFLHAGSNGDWDIKSKNFSSTFL